MAFWDFLKRKESVANTALTSIYTPGLAQYTPVRYEALAKEGYEQNPIIYRCISTIAQAMGALKFRVSSGDKEFSQHPIIDLLNRPNPLLSGSGFIETVTSHLLLSGNAYIELTNERELWALRPDRVKIIAGSKGMPGAYEYGTGMRDIRFPVDPISGACAIGHWKTFSPINNFYGQPVISAAAGAADQHNASSTWNLALLQNSARPSGAVIYAPKDGSGKLTPEQFERLKKQLEQSYQSSRNAGRPMVLDGGLEWHEMGLSPKDMDWSVARDIAAREIAQVFKVPSQLIGLPDAQTYSNFAEARLAFYEDCVLPLADSLTDMLNRWLVPRFDKTEKAYVWVDVDEISALEPRRSERRMSIQGAEYLTINEKREALGYEPVDGGDVVAIPAGLIPLTDLSIPIDDGDPADAEETYGRR